MFTSQNRLLTALHWLTVEGKFIQLIL